MKKAKSTVRKDPNRKARRAAVVKVKQQLRHEALVKREKEVAKLNKLMSAALNQKRREAVESGEDFDPSAVIQDILKEAQSTK